MNDDIVIVRRLVATLLSAMWHLLQTPPSTLFSCDMALVMLVVVVMGMGDRCEWRPLVMATVVVTRWWVGVVKDGGGGG